MKISDFVFPSDFKDASDYQKYINEVNQVEEQLGEFAFLAMQMASIYHAMGSNPLIMSDITSHNHRMFATAALEMDEYINSGAITYDDLKRELVNANRRILGNSKHYINHRDSDDIMNSFCTRIYSRYQPDSMYDDISFTAYVLCISLLIRGTRSPITESDILLALEFKSMIFDFIGYEWEDGCNALLYPYIKKNIVERKFASSEFRKIIASYNPDYYMF